MIKLREEADGLECAVDDVNDVHVDETVSVSVEPNRTLQQYNLIILIQWIFSVLKYPILITFSFIRLLTCRALMTYYCAEEILRDDIVVEPRRHVGVAVIEVSQCCAPTQLRDGIANAKVQ